MGGGQPGEGRPGGFGGGFADMTPEERQKRMQERLASMTPEEREAFFQRMRDRGIDPNNVGASFRGPGGPGGPGGPVAPAAPASAVPTAPRRPARQQTGQPSAPQTGQTIDQLFGPLPITESFGRVWLFVANQLKSERLHLGITDGTYTELLSGSIQPGQDLVTAVVTPAQAAASANRSPLMPGGPGMGGRPPGGSFPGGGGGGGGQRR
jgi:hypothetical protein